MLVHEATACVLQIFFVPCLVVPAGATDAISGAQTTGMNFGSMIPARLNRLTIGAELRVVVRFPPFGMKLTRAGFAKLGRQPLVAVEIPQPVALAAVLHPLAPMPLFVSGKPVRVEVSGTGKAVFRPCCGEDFPVPVIRASGLGARTETFCDPTTRC